MVRCKHFNVIIKEEYVCWTAHFIENGKLEGHNNDSDKGEYTGMIEVVCQDCDLEIRRHKTKLPKWAKEYYEQSLVRADNAAL